MQGRAALPRRRGSKKITGSRGHPPARLFALSIAIVLRPKSEVSRKKLLLPIRFLTSDPGRDVFFEHIERQRARVDDLIVESANVELIAELLFRTVAEREDLQ